MQSKLGLITLYSYMIGFAHYLECCYDLNWKQKELFGNEHESSPPLSLDHYFKIVCSQKLISPEIHRSAIMQDFRYSEEKRNDRLAASFDFSV